MNTIEKSILLVNVLADETNELSFPESLKVRASLGCLGIALDHHHAITILVQNNRIASAFSLARLLYESFLRGAWLSHCASDFDVSAFMSGKEPPKTGKMTEALKKVDAYAGEHLAKMWLLAWEPLCDYTHSGALHVQRWQTNGAIEPDYSSEEISEVMGFVNLFASLAALEIAQMADESEREHRLIERLQPFFSLTDLRGVVF